MKYFNGRVLLRGLNNGHGYMCAHSKAEAVRVAKGVGLNFNINELNDYWANCWGTAAERVLGEQTEPGFFLEIEDKFFKFCGKEVK